MKIMIYMIHEIILSVTHYRLQKFSAMDKSLMEGNLGIYYLDRIRES